MAKIADLTPDRKNANTGTERGRYLLDHSLAQYGAGRSILVDKEGRVIAGNKTLEAAAELGIEDVEIVETDGTRLVAVKRTDLDLENGDGRARLLAYADNRASELDLEWNTEQLRSDIESGLDLGDLWRDTELLKMGAIDPPPAPEAEIDRAEELRQKWGVELGQLWEVGRHRVLCGDCAEGDVMARLMDAKASLLLTDPPYNVAYSGLGQSTGKQMIDFDDQTPEQFWDWLSTSMRSIDDWLMPGGAIYLCHGDTGKNALPFINIFSEMGWVRSSAIIWVKQAASMGWQDYRSQHECLAYGWKSGAERKKIEDRSETTVWKIDRDGQATYNHPTQKPVELMARAIRNSSDSDDIVLDPFMGSGPVIAACETLERAGRGMDISPAYVAVTLERLSKMGLEPKLIDS